MIEYEQLQFQVCLKNAKIAVTDIDCPDKICIKTAYIGKAGHSIVCLPNRVIIRTVGEADKEEIEAENEEIKEETHELEDFEQEESEEQEVENDEKDAQDN
jgi:hypothetical protein